MTGRLPIAIVVKRFPKLSETFILSELLALEALGWPVTIFTLAPPTDSVVHPDVAKVRANVVQLDLRDPLRHLADQVRHRGIVHIHAHFAGEPAAIARKAARRAGVGYSISAHAKDIYLTDPALLRENLTSAKFVATCTSHNAQYLRKAAPGVPVAKLYHGIDCNRLHPGNPTERTAVPLILSVGRLRTKKGLDVLIDACAQLRDRGLAFACEIVGYGPEEANLRRQIGRLGLQDRIAITGKLGHDAVLDRMRAASVFALPCRIDPDGDRDGIPNVILEAMAMGLPVVSTPVSGVPEIVTHGLTGWLVPPEDPAALADCLAGLLGREPDGEVIAKARAAVRSRFGEGRDIAMLDRLLIGAIRQDDPGIGYVIKGFPRLSESFISAEVLRLERLGKRITVFALAQGDELAEPVLTDLGSPLAYMPNAGSVRRMNLWQWLRHISANYAAIHWRLLRRRPKRMVRNLVAGLAVCPDLSAPHRTLRQAILLQAVRAGRGDCRGIAACRDHPSAWPFLPQCHDHHLVRRAACRMQLQLYRPRQGHLSGTSQSRRPAPAQDRCGQFRDHLHRRQSRSSGGTAGPNSFASHRLSRSRYPQVRAFQKHGTGCPTADRGRATRREEGLRPAAWRRCVCSASAAFGISAV